MVLVNSQMLALGTRMPEFELKDVVSGKGVSSEDFRNKKAMLVMFICRHCPYVQHVERELARVGEDYGDKDVGIVAISSNDPNYDSEDEPGSLAEQAKLLGFVFPYFFDDTQEVAKAFTAACTPDFFVFEKHRKLVYRGQLDESRPGNNKPVTGKDLRAALDAVLSDKAVSRDQKPSSGCNIKWKPGNEPDYFK